MMFNPVVNQQLALERKPHFPWKLLKTKPPSKPCHGIQDRSVNFLEGNSFTLW